MFCRFMSYATSGAGGIRTLPYRLENKTIDENFMKEIISQGLPMKQEKVLVKEDPISNVKVEQSS